MKPAVLIVDDVDANLVAMEGHLARLDCELVLASSGNQALSLMLQRDIAVILLDVHMPDMDGFEVARWARENAATRDVPIIFVTAMHENEESLHQAYGVGAIDVLFKPVNPYVLRSKIQVFLELHLGRQRLAAEVEAHKETARELEAFSFSVSHDLRAPLRQIGAFGEHLAEDYGPQLDRDGLELLASIQGCVVRMSALIEDLLALSRSGRAQLEVQPLDLVPVARRIIGELRAEAPERSVDFVCPSELHVAGGPGLVRIVLENLLRNAWKFTSKLARARIELGTGIDHGERVCFVRDDGAGFDQRYADQLFQAFRRLHTTSEFEGNGIGLAIVQRIVRRHGGRVWAESRLAQGATFYFTLPERLA